MYILYFIKIFLIKTRFDEKFLCYKLSIKDIFFYLSSYSQSKFNRLFYLLKENKKNIRSLI